MRFQLIIVSLILGIVISFIINTVTNEPMEIASFNAPNEQNYDYFMTNVNRLHFSLDGQADYRILAKRLTHFPDPDFTIIEAPNFVLFQNDASPWLISAENGKILQDTELMQDKVELSTNVIIHSVDKNGQTLDLYTDFLTLYPDTNYISTDREVRLISAKTETSSLGMTADLTAKVITFLANVKGYYE